MALPRMCPTGAYPKNSSRAGQSSTDNADTQEETIYVADDGTQQQDSDDYNDAEKVNVSQLQEQIHTLSKNQSQTNNVLGQILD